MFSITEKKNHGYDCIMSHIVMCIVYISCSEVYEVLKMHM